MKLALVSDAWAPQVNGIVLAPTEFICSMISVYAVNCYKAMGIRNVGSTG